MLPQLYKTNGSALPSSIPVDAELMSLVSVRVVRETPVPEPTAYTAQVRTQDTYSAPLSDVQGTH